MTSSACLPDKRSFSVLVFGFGLGFEKVNHEGLENR